MKLSLWSQFSSNNSVNYAVVGTFNSEEATQQAQQRLRRLFGEMLELRRRLDDNEITPRQFEKLLKRDFVRKYEPWSQNPLNWRRLCSWLPVSFHVRLGDHMSVFGTHIVFDSDGMTTSPIGVELRDILALLGAKTHAQIYGKAPDVPFRVICRAPDTSTALAMYETLLNHLYIRNEPYDRPSHDVFVPTPWAIHHPQLQGLTHEQYAVLPEIWELWFATVGQWFGLDRAVYQLHLGQLRTQAPLLMRTMRVWQQTMLQDISISHHDQTIVFEEPRLTRNLILAIPAIHGWMEQAGCIVTYEFLSEEASG
jgi:hypothetical protein